MVQSELTDVPEELRPPDPLPPVKLRPIDAERFGTRYEGVNDVVVFLDFQRGRPGYLFSGGRVAPRTGGRRPAKTAAAKRASATERAPSG